MRSADERLPLRHAVALGLLQGPAELLPVSSSAHTTLLPWLAGWPYASLDGEVRKSFEVVLHAGAGAALAIDMRREPTDVARGERRMPAGPLALALAPAAIAGLVLRRAIEARVGGPRSIAAGLAAGGAAMALADSRAGGAEGKDSGHSLPRGCADAQLGDGLALGLAQASALVPGISRNGATLTAARARGFARESAQGLSFTVGLPVILAASALEATRLLRGRVPRGARPALAAGAASAFASTFLTARLLRRPWLQRGPLLPYSLYRALLAVLVIRRLRRAPARP